MFKNLRQIRNPFIWIFLLFLFSFSFVFVFKDDLQYEYQQFRKLSNGKITDLRCMISNNSRRVSFYSDSLYIIGDLYKSKNLDNPPCILLLHGSSVWGRKLPLMQVLAQKFQELGYTVLAIDLRGYGESDDPEYLKSPKDFDFTQDVQAAIDFLISEILIDTSKIYVIGHSFGGGVALAAHLRDERIKKLVLIGPSRRLKERFFNPGAPDREYFLARWKDDMQLSYELNFSIWRKVREPLDIEMYLDIFTMPGHIPLFLIDGEKESKEDLDFLRAISQQLTPPVNYWTVPNTGHYLNTGFLFKRPCYNQRIISEFVNKVDEWLKN